MGRVSKSFLSVEKLIGSTPSTKIGTELLATSIYLNAETKALWFKV